MMRNFTLLCLIAALGSGFYLFQTKNQAMLLDREIARVMKQTDIVRQRAGLMRTEYALLNDPSRLAELSGGLLPDLKTTAPTQFASFAELERRLPAIGAPMPAAPLEPQAPNAMVPKVVPVKAEPMRPEPAKVEPARTDPARTDPTRTDPVKTERPMMAAAPAPRPAPPAAPPVAIAATVPAVTTVALANPPPFGVPPRPPLSLAAPLATPVAPVAAAALPVPPSVTPPAAPPAAPPAGRSVLAAAHPGTPPVPPRQPPATPAEAVARIARGEPVNPAIPAVASALGMARTMVPSTISSAQAGILR